MSSLDPRAFAHVVGQLTTQVQRIADALTTTAARAVADASSAEQADFALAPTPTDEDALRAARRDSLLVLLSRAERGVLKPHEAELLRNHVEAEIHEGNTSRSVARSNLRHVKTLVPELEQAQGAIERVRHVAELIEAGAPWTANHQDTARRIRAALDAEPGTEH